MAKTFALTIRAARNEALLSQATVAARAGIAQSQYSRIELGVSTTTAATARGICSALGLGPPFPAIAAMEAIAAAAAKERDISLHQAKRELAEEFKQAYAVFEATAG